MLACGYGLLDIVQYLKSHNLVDPSIDNNKAIVVASCCGHGQVVKTLLKDVRVEPVALA